MEVFYKGIAHPWLCDAMGHMTTRHYLATFDDASYHLLRHAFGYAGPSGEFADSGWADVRHVLEYKAEVGAGTLLEVRGALTKLGGKSLTARYEMVNLASGEVVATLEAVTAYFDLKARKAIPLTDAMRKAAERVLSAS